MTCVYLFGDAPSVPQIIPSESRRIPSTAQFLTPKETHITMRMGTVMCNVQFNHAGIAGMAYLQLLSLFPMYWSYNTA
jgi:hypothetical protein